MTNQEKLQAIIDNPDSTADAKTIAQILLTLITDPMG